MSSQPSRVNGPAVVGGPPSAAPCYIPYVAPRQRFAFRYALPLLPLFWLLGMGPASSSLRLDDITLRVRMGPWFRCSVPRTAIRHAVHAPDSWWAIGVHTDFAGHWVVNGSPRGMVQVRLEPPAAGAFFGIPIRVRWLSLGLEDPDGFLAALAAPDG